MLVQVALAKKMACIVWALMARGGVYPGPIRQGIGGSGIVAITMQMADNDRT
ncbi:hypothetical protein P775_06790 [Puniceibacterium antarcticum]|uniref:Uncharacterized protein n=1 Tax=Puniceibacterium antarcticum TaxID=1206336 RepID=A0A2G8RHC1_9RHOB|nr:hypothetical protein P775_06790 [Puniceibacterium antarcticum]